MSTLRSSSLWITVLAVMVMAMTSTSMRAQTETTIYDFGSTSPTYPRNGLTVDAAGNLYGVSAYNNGVVYKLSLVSGAWQATVLYTFTGKSDGGTPYATPVFDSAGNLYGTTEYGGNFTSPYCGTVGCGVVYKLSPSSSGEWTETVLYAFTGGKDGGFPIQGNVVLDKAGNIYGSNVAGGNIYSLSCQNTSGCGVIFQLQPMASGKWKFNVVHLFSGGWDGVGPAQLAFNSAGLLFGSAAGAWGGWEFPNAPGLVFHLTPTASGQWKDTVVYSFTGGTDGGLPSNLTFDKAGNIYGAGADGGTINNCWSGYGPIGCGVVFEISRSSTGKWTETPLYAFTGGSDGSQPDGGVVFDKGSLYGTTWGGGTGSGVVFQLTPTTGGTWSETVAHTFSGSDGSIPVAPLAVDSSGNIFGTTLYGGSSPSNYGVAFEITP